MVSPLHRDIIDLYIYSIYSEQFHLVYSYHGIVLYMIERVATLIDGLLTCVQISITLNKEEPATPLAALMKTRGADRLREVLGSYVGFLKTGQPRPLLNSLLLFSSGTTSFSSENSCKSNSFHFVHLLPHWF